MTFVQSRLLELIQQRALLRGDFTLRSGKKSTYYINSKNLLFHSESAALIGEIVWRMVKNLNLDAIGGLELGAIPMVTAVILRHHYKGVDLEGFIIRKEKKDHGVANLIEGMIPPNSKVAILDDVLTTGDSTLNAIKIVEKAGHKVQTVICLVDRLQGARETLRGYHFTPIFTVEDLGINPEMS